MGDPVGACRARGLTLADGGTIMLVEPMAGDTVDDNLNPVGAAYYAFSTLLCTPSSRSQEVGAALGAQAGEARLRDVAAEAGSPRCAGWPRPRSTWSSNCGRDVRPRPEPPHPYHHG